MTEISGSGVREGMQVVAGEQGKEDQEGEDAAEGEKTSNPFAQNSQGQQTATRTNVAKQGKLGVRS